MTHGCERRDYTGRCPEGWVPTGNGKCAAPLSYGGPCSSTANIALYNEAMKQQWAAKCEAEWPCVDCVRDYSQPCPIGWVDIGGGVCDAPLAYDHHCSMRVRMTNEQFKRSWGAECAVYWPCQKTCSKQDFGQACPEGWGAFDGICEAPPDRSYVGPCAPFANLQGLTEHDKAQYAALCQVEFACQSGQPEAPECQPSAAPCPKGWQHKGSSVGFCQGVLYEGPCRPLIAVDRLASIGKLKYMEMCGVEWDCVARSPMGATAQALGPGRVHSGPVGQEGRIVDPSA